jgi:hypothetical protein
MGALAELSCLERDYERSEMEFERIVFFLKSPEAAKMKESELEREIEKRTRELMRLFLQEHIDGRGAGMCEQGVRGADGVDRTRVRLQERKIESIFGTIDETRAGYGYPGADSLHPLDAELNLPAERHSLELRRRVADQAAGNSFDETYETIKKSTGAKIAKRQIEELTVRAAWDFDAFYHLRRAETSDGPCGGSILVISADGKGVVMRPEDLREHTRKAAKKAKQKMGTRLSKGEKKNRKRMATVAAVYTVAPYLRKPEDLVGKGPFHLDGPLRPRPERKRVWASLEKEPEEVIGQAFEEARRRDPDGQKTWVALVDGNWDQIRILKRIAKENGLHITIIVDLIHVIEYLWKAGRAFHPESGPELESWVEHRLLEILRGKASLMAGGMRRSATRKELSEKEREPVDTCAAYLLSHAQYLGYDRYLAQGLPVATGVIEGACRHLVKDRMDVTGARWSLTGAEAVLRLRALKSSHDFEQYWSFHETREFERNHKNLYADGKVPAVISPMQNRSSKQNRQRGHLKVIK